MRADARRNRERLLAAARAEFGERGPGAPLDDVARRAGLGSGTLYRHFPTRDALLQGVYRGEIDALCASARELLDSPSPGDALAEWLRRVIQLTSGDGLAPALMGSMRERPSEFVAACHDALRAVGAPLLGRAQAAGDVRTDVELLDVMGLTHAIATMPGGADRADRLLTLLLDGLRADASRRRAG